MFKFKYMNDIYAKAARAVSSAESNARYWQGEIDYNLSLLADLRGENGEKIADRRRWSMEADGVCDYYDEFGRMTYLTVGDLRRGVVRKIYLFKKELTSAKKVLAERQAELERVQSLLAEEEARICAPVVEEEDDDLDF